MRVADCPVCEHPKRREIQRALVYETDDYESVAGPHGFTAGALKWHVRIHLQPVLHRLALRTLRRALRGDVKAYQELLSIDPDFWTETLTRLEQGISGAHPRFAAKRAEHLIRTVLESDKRTLDEISADGWPKS